MFPVLARRLHVACLYLAYHLGFPKLAGGGEGQQEGEGWLTCARRLLSNIGWPLLGYLMKVTLTSVMPRTKSQTLLYHVKYLLAYLNITSSLLGRKVMTTLSQ